MIDIINPYALVLALIPILYVTLIMAHPLKALTLLAELKRRYRRWIVQRHGTEAANTIERKLRANAGKDKLAQKAIDMLMRQERAHIIEEHGSAYANQSLGSPDVIERDF